MTEAEIHKILSEALDADESGNKTLAISLYTKTVEEILRIEDKELRNRLNRFANHSLDRAEKLKGILRPDLSPIQSPTQPLATSNLRTVVPVHSTYYDEQNRSSLNIN